MVENPTARTLLDSALKNMAPQGYKPKPYVKGYYVDENNMYRSVKTPVEPPPGPVYPVNMYTRPQSDLKASDGKLFGVTYTGTYPWPGPDRPEDNVKAIAKIGAGGLPYSGDDGKPATDINGTVYLDQINDGAAKVTFCIMKLPPGEYGIHIQEVKPFGVEPDVPVRHIAEIATVKVDSSGIASGQVNRVRVALKAEGVMDQATVMVHAKPDKSSEVIAYGTIHVNGHEKKNPNWAYLEPDEKTWYTGAANKKMEDHEWQLIAKTFKSPFDQ